MLKKYDSNTGKYLKTLIEEKDEKYVHPLHPMIFLIMKSFYGDLKKTDMIIFICIIKRGN